MTAPRRSRGWIWFFVALVGLATVWVSIEIWYNLAQQLKPEQVAEARQRWAEKAPADFDLKYTLERASRAGERYRLERGDPFVLRVDGQDVEPALYPLFDLPLAWEHWAQTSPQSPDVTETEFTAPPQVTRKFAVQVRAGKVVGVSCNEQPVPAPLWRFCDMTALLAACQRRLELDRQPGGGRFFCIAAFDPQDGHLLRYVRSISRTEEKVQIVINALTPVHADESP
jgi:hypothetical protein